VIRNPELFASSKLIDYTQINCIMPRGIEPSDIDMIIDNKGCMLLGDFKNHRRGWFELETGQRRLFQNFLRLPLYDGQGAAYRAMVVILHHTPEFTGVIRGVPAIRIIDDLIEFQWIRYKRRPNGLFLTVSKWIPGYCFKDFVEWWFDFTCEKAKQLTI
jgi:hypothetical protein